MDLLIMHCAPGGKASALGQDAINNHLQSLGDWEQQGSKISKTFTFKNYYETLAFVNASAFISHREDHHPDLSVHYNRCVVSYSTHDAGGLTHNDFICAAKVNALLTVKS